jgi:hypothetical protein
MQGGEPQTVHPRRARAPHLLSRLRSGSPQTPTPHPELSEALAKDWIIFESVAWLSRSGREAQRPDSQRPIRVDVEDAIVQIRFFNGQYFDIDSVRVGG